MEAEVRHQSSCMFGGGRTPHGGEAGSPCMHGWWVSMHEGSITSMSGWLGSMRAWLVGLPTSIRRLPGVSSASRLRLPPSPVIGCSTPHHRVRSRAPTSLCAIPACSRARPHVHTYVHLTQVHTCVHTTWPSAGTWCATSTLCPEAPSSSTLVTRPM